MSNRFHNAPLRHKALNLSQSHTHNITLQQHFYFKQKYTLPLKHKVSFIQAKHLHFRRLSLQHFIHTQVYINESAFYSRSYCHLDKVEFL